MCALLTLYVVYCSVVQCVAVCVAVWCIELQCGAVHCSVMQCVALAVCGSVLQFVAVNCSLQQHMYLP